MRKRSPRLALWASWCLASILLVGSSVSAATPDRGSYQTTIVVDWSIDADPGDGNDTCTYSQGGLFVPAPDGKCTFRRALREAGARPDADRPILITFTGLETNLAGTDQVDDVNFDAALGVWTLPIASNTNLPELKRQSILDSDGRVTIRGETAIRGAGAGPSVFLDSVWPLRITIDNNEIDGIGFIGGGSIRLSGANNIVRNSTWGLSQDGQSIVFQDSPPDPSLAGAQGIFVSADGDGARIYGNVISGASTRAIEVNSQTTGVEIYENYIGTRADGTVPELDPDVECQAQFSYDPADWYGGWGVSLAGSGAEIRDNVFAGMQNMRSTNDTPPMAIEVFGSEHLITDNFLGVDANGDPVGTCGQGIKFSGTNHQVLDNTMVRVRKGFENTDGALLWSDDTFTDDGGNTVRGNLSIDGPEKLYEMGPMVGSTIRTFEPAMITSLVGRNVTGAAVTECDACIIDFYIDDLDGNAEALVHAGSLVAGADGSFSGMLTASPSPVQGVRTMTTSVAADQIGDTLPGTTSEPSTTLYLPDLSDLLFYDGFETGDTSVWSARSPESVP